MILALTTSQAALWSPDAQPTVFGPVGCKDCRGAVPATHAQYRYGQNRSGSCPATWITTADAAESSR